MEEDTRTFEEKIGDAGPQETFMMLAEHCSITAPFTFALVSDMVLNPLDSTEVPSQEDLEKAMMMDTLCVILVEVIRQSASKNGK